MCGIYGYIGENDPMEKCIEGLSLLEYRGYDSTGIGGIRDGQLSIYKAAGKLSNLKKLIENVPLSVAIGHTRWATHGKVNEQNAHPQHDKYLNCAIVHNGIIENYDLLKEELKELSYEFQSDTDTEVVAQLIQHHYRGDLLFAVHETIQKIKGHFAFAVIHKDHPDLIVAAAKDCPLAIGFDDNGKEAIVSSDPNTFLGSTFNVLFLESAEIAKVHKSKVEVFDAKLRPIAKKLQRFENKLPPPSKEGFDHFMIKEIFEQPKTIQKALDGKWEEFENLPDDMKNPKNVWFIGCGTSSHAGMIGALLLEDFAKIYAHCEIASEARFRMIPPETLIIAISQSGETADTIAAIKEIRAKGYKVLGITNVVNSSITRETDATLFLNAGPEMSVCSTKAFTSQLTVLTQYAIFVSKKKHLLDYLQKIPILVEKTLELRPKIEKIAKKYSKYKDFFFMGRRYMYPTCLEAALKLKEISYANANGYPAGELKHGPIALIDASFPVIAFTSNLSTQEKILSNLQEVKARGAPTFAIASEQFKEVENVVDDVLFVPSTIDELSTFCSTIVGQLFAYYIALEKGCDIDQPRNLAKSVTVE